MAEEPKETAKKIQSFCEGIPFAEMMRKMMAAKKAPGSFNCAEMMSQMMEMCRGARRKEEESHPRTPKE